MSGFIALPRDFKDDLLELPPNALKLLIVLLFRANWGDTLTCKRGSLFDTTRGLSEKSGLSRQQVRSALRTLTLFQIISQKSTNRRTDIQIVNYDRFSGTSSKSTNEQPTANQRTTNDQPSNKTLTSKEVKELNNTYVQNEFERVWARYPKRRGRKAALRHFIATVKTEADVLSINGALDAYLTDLKRNGTDIQYTQNGSTWFNDWQSWKDQPSAKLTPPKQISPPTIQSWNIIPKDEELVSPDDIKALLKNLGSRKAL